MARKTVRLGVGVAALAAVIATASALAANPPAKPISGPGGPGVVYTLRANLSASKVASLQVASTATGRFIGGVFRNGVPVRGERPTVTWNLFWAVGVTNTTGPITGVEIRKGEAGTSAAASSAFLTLCSPCNNISASAAGAAGTTLRGGVIRNLTPEQATALRRSDLFVSVMTAANPGGELQGQVTRPKPVTTAAPPNNRMPNPIKPIPGGTPSGP